MINKIFTHRVDADLGKSLSGKIKLTQMFIIGAWIVVNTYLPLVVSQPTALRIVVVSNIYYAIVFSVHFYKMYNVSRLMLVIGPSIPTIGIYLICSGPNTDFFCKFTIMATIILPLVIIDIRETKLMIASVLLVVLSFYFSETIGGLLYNVHRPTGDVLPAFRFMSPAINFFMFVLGFYHMQALNIKAENNIAILLENEKKLNAELVIQKKKEFDQKVSELKMRSLAAQMNPHFIFNALNSVQHYIMISERQAAYDYLSKFAHLVRRILQHVQKTSISLSDELETIHLYMQLEYIRFCQNFEYSIQVDPQINTNETCIPPMLIQPYIENALLHGLLNKQGTGKISVSFKQELNVLRCCIEDNGIGRRNAEDIKRNNISQFASLSTGITRERLEIINAYSASAASVEITDVVDENNNPKGTRVEILLRFDE